LKKGHEVLFDFLYEQSDTTTQLLVSCLLARRAEAEAIAAAHPKLVPALSNDDLELLPRYCWETNEDSDAVKLMLDVGFPIAHPEHTHGFTALHNAAWSGSADLVELLLSRGHPVDLIDPRYHASALDYAIYDCTVEKRHPDGDFRRVAQALVEAGCRWDALQFPFGDKRIDEVLEPHMHQRVDGAALLNDEAALDHLLGQNPSVERLSVALAGAAKGAHTALCARLLQAGADVNGTCGNLCLTPLMWAVSARSLETVALLLEKLADARAKNANHSTALHMALVRGAGAKIIELLLQSGAGADIGAANEFGQSPLSFAQETGREDLVELLQRYR
jgi:ankyrin repeat protein